MILLPPITREEDLLPAIDLLFRGEALAVVASFGRPERLPPEIVWQSEPNIKGLRCVRRKSDMEIDAQKVGSRYTPMMAMPEWRAHCSCG